MAEPDDRRILWRLIAEIGPCMLTTRVGADLRARPMIGVAQPDGAAIWFLSDRAGGKDADLAADRHACLTYADPRMGLFVSLSGTIEIISDRRAVEALWSGAPDHLCKTEHPAEAKALRFVPTAAEYWDGSGSTLSAPDEARTARIGFEEKRA